MRRTAAILALVFLALPLGAQEPPQEQEEEGFRVRVKVELVTAPLVVRDARGEFVYDLQRGEVTVFDNGVPQQLTDFELASEPISLVILLDTSRRVAPLLDRVRKSGVLFTSYILGQFGEAAVMTFDTDLNLRQEFTSDPDKIIDAVASIPAGGDGRRLADALDWAVNALLDRPEGRRRVIVAITEPSDDGSRLPVGMPLRHAQLAEISVYTISLSATQADLMRRPEETPVPDSPYPPGVFPMPPTPGQVQTPTTEANRQYARLDLLNAIVTLVSTLKHTRKENVLELYAHGTGGLNYSSWSRTGFENSINEIGQDLHNQYQISYRPSNRDQEGFHRVEVQVSRPGTSVRTRPGYYVGPPPG
jgi:VWFA-related protein